MNRDYGHIDLLEVLSVLINPLFSSEQRMSLKSLRGHSMKRLHGLLINTSVMCVMLGSACEEATEALR